MLPFLFAVATTGFQVASSISAANSEARALQENARLRDLQAKDTLRRAEDNVRILLRQGDRIQAEQTAGFAASGVDVGTGSPLLKLQETASLIAEEASRVRYEAQVDARTIQAGAEQMRRQAEDVKSAGLVSAAGSVLGLGATAYSLFGDRNKKGTA